MKISARSRNCHCADAASRNVYRAAVVSARDHCFGLPAYALLRSRCFGNIIQFPVIYCGAIHVGYNRALSKLAAAFFTACKWNVRRRCRFKDKRKIGCDGVCRCSCSPKSHFLLNHKGEHAVILKLGLYQFYHNAAAEAVVNSLALDEAVTETQEFRIKVYPVAEIYKLLG